MNEADRRAIEHLALALPLKDADLRMLGGCSPLGQAALLLAANESAIDAFYEYGAASSEPISRVLRRAADRDDVADMIDDALEQDPTVLADLCRAQIAWSHPALESLLDRAEYRGPAAHMLALTDYEPLERWLDAEHTPAELVDVARSIASTGVAELFDAASPWVAPVRDDDPGLGAQLEAALFVLSPNRWARGFLQGLFGADFLNDSLAMADVLTASGPSYWSGALARFVDHEEEFASVARMAACGAAAMLFFAGDDEPSAALVDAFYTEDWGTLAAHPAFAVAMALAEESHWQQPLLESAAHDLMLSRGIESPGIGGLPLSASQPDHDEIAAAVEASRQADLDPIALVTTICDVLELRSIAEFAALPDEFRGFRDSEHAAVAATARELDEPVDLDEQIRLAADETLSGMAAAERIARLGTRESRLALVHLWADGPLSRAPLYAALLHQELRTLPLELMEK